MTLPTAFVADRPRAATVTGAWKRRPIPNAHAWTRSATRAWYVPASTPWLKPPVYRFLKRGMDLTGALVLLPIALPVLALCILAIKLDSPGPAVFVQPRTGKNGRRFGMFKLRTMVKNAAELKAKYMHLNEHTYPDFKITNDPRMTRIGHVLRKLSLDELPQLFNVIRGDMTLVGPRPTSFGAETYRLWHTERLAVKPGLTGLWQVSGRSDLDFDDRLRLDVAYIRHRRLSLDIQILLRTVSAVLTTRGAN